MLSVAAALGIATGAIPDKRERRTSSDGDDRVREHGFGGVRGGSCVALERQ
jgi:hypothetical protein